MEIENSAKCANCIYCDIDDTNKADIVVFCAKKNEKYHFGQRIHCEWYAVKKITENKS